MNQIPAKPRGPLNVSRRKFLLGGAATLAVASTGTGLTLATFLPTRVARAQQAGVDVAAFLELLPDGTAVFQSPFIEGGQGIYSAMAQIVGEELDLDPARFIVQAAPSGDPFGVMGGMRITGGSSSVRSSYQVMRQLGASARAMLIEAAAQEWDVDASELTTEPGLIIHAASGREIAYGDLAAAAMDLPVPTEVALKDPAQFRWIRQPLARLDVRDKSTGRANFSIDFQVEDMLTAAVQHAPRLGLVPASITNQSEIEQMRGVHSVHMLAGAVAVVADKFWQARRAVEACEVEWEPGEAGVSMPEDFSSQAFRATLADEPGPGTEVEAEGDALAALEAAETVIEAAYDAPYLAHAQLEPPSATARFNEDGTLDVWLPNQAPEMFQAAIATQAGIEPENVRIHSQMLGGFFGRHFLYGAANPFRQAIALAQAIGRPVKVLWTREEEFLRDALRPMGYARFRGAVDENGPVALSIEVVGEGAASRWFGSPPDQDGGAHEGLTAKPYAIADRRVGHVVVKTPAEIGFWRSVGHSMHDYFYESFLDEMAQAAGLDPFEMRMNLLSESERHRNLLAAVGDLSGGWQPGPYTADDGTTRARGVAMASPFGSEVATIAEVSVLNDSVQVHQIWVAIDPGQIVNPAVIEAQVQSAVALGVSQTLVEELVYENGQPTARNFGPYQILRPSQMPQVHVKIIESGAPMGGIGEPGVPGVPPAIVNAVATLTGQRIRSLPLSKHSFS
ncbi:xanthine dehydrogenase family protein molybdopterin-binding subunit [Pelagibacterium sp. 26DY04]|uniref:xanthine dehydrogenase family protein molybdopterin-binding subunit n=1 Tax=Pelagibacterium sp. 26DY04 TaxID=2967130 RepID=UPI002816131D|nr:xanthine dehydrogenase family protein molybdopterin-binding subunit [Pelagibacterium sp. 26DY04]WMT85265.1 xanthine dehydrogenase family protein molybdopterin-binding subunit [Pelagibacterium sp. 26DY04]